MGISEAEMDADTAIDATAESNDVSPSWVAARGGAVAEAASVE
jgi:hypothetical protein